MDTVIVDESINFFAAPGMIVNGWNTTVSGVKMDGDVAYTTITFKANGQAALHNTAANKGVMKDVTNVISGGTGRYLVMKVRIGGTSMSDIGIGLWDGQTPVPTAAPYSEANPNVDVIFAQGEQRRNTNVSMVDKINWTIYVIDLEGLSQTYYDAQNTDIEKISVGLKRVSGAEGDADSYMDIAYLAIVDNWTEIATVVGDTTTNVKYVAQWNDAAKDVTRTSGNKCVDHQLGQPVITTDGGDTVYTYTCEDADCGETFTVVSPEGTNYFSAPGQQVNNWATANSPTAGMDNGSSGTKYILDTVIADSTDGVYVRVYLNQGGHFFLANGTVAAGNHSDKTVDDVIANNEGIGQYAVFKVRVGGGNTSLGFKITSDTGANIGFAHREPNREFVTYVVDLSGVANADAQKVRVFLQGTTSASGAPAGGYMDVAYFAIVDDWSEVVAIVGEDATVKFATDFTKPALDQTVIAGEMITATVNND